MMPLPDHLQIAEREKARLLLEAHTFKALRCWAQAGDPHRALQMSDSLLSTPSLTARQRSQLEQYQATLEQRWVSWMEQWSQPVFASA